MIFHRALHNSETTEIEHACEKTNPRDKTELQYMLPNTIYTTLSNLLFY